MLNNFESLRVLKPHFYLRLTLVKMRSLVFKIFCNVAGVLKSCKMNIFFLLIRIMGLEMLLLFQRVKSIRCLWNTKTDIQDI